ncbi:hypothetical protein ACFFQW_02225 [Umezawaea endophytica]|uniref:Uncharacterized protein n=1 Tax=Umezawaea endophytica TaxID=1654476 RepID=A0A9X2VJ63_9PSEU|nr:hypothetical protein [Umezawaea endophytica]MCS7477067.1 hypothetical protein [Umezawaea endophytica]
MLQKIPLDHAGSSSLVVAPRTGFAGDEHDRWRRRALVLVSMIAAALLTALVFVVRAGGDAAANWPVNWELWSSDNGVLFQLLQDVAAGRVLDWSFSPQVYVFPELPVSALAFVLAGGDVYAYYLLVAAINNALLFGALLLVVRLLFPGARVTAHLARAAVAWLPLVILPLVGTAWMFSFHLAPTYYFGMYLVLLGAPALHLARSRRARRVIACAIALTAASNPLVLVFAVPALVLVGVLVAWRFGRRAIGRPAWWLGGVLGAAFVVRVVAFTGLQGTSPFTYVDLDLFRARLDGVWPHAADPPGNLILLAGLLAAVGCLVGAVLAGRLYWRRREPRHLVAVWYGLVPLVGLAGTIALLITHQYYLWPVLVAPMIFLLLAVPFRAAPWTLATGLVALVALVVTTSSFGDEGRYFGHRSAETRCLDDVLPVGHEIGYATFSDARRLSLTSERGIRFIPLKSSGVQATWLTNLDYLHADTGTFFYLNEVWGEPVIDKDLITRSFGAPDQVLGCGDRLAIWLYDDPAKLARITGHFHVRQR